MSSKRIKSVPGGASKIRKKKSQEAETKRLSGSILQFVKITPKNLEENQNGDEQENENGDEQEKEQNNENGDGSDEQEKEQDNDNRDEQENEHDNENGDEQEKEHDNGNEQGEGRTFDAREYSIDGDINDPGSWPKVDDINKVVEILDFLKKMESCYPNTWTACRIMMTIPVSVASAERSFSKLKLIKSYLRSTMSQDRLNGLSMLSIERGMTEKLNFTELMNEFAARNASRIIFQE